MDVEKIVMFAGVGFAIAVGAFVLWGPAPRPRKRGRVTGINNLGYTCFLNSLLQALAACPTFVSWLKRQREKNSKSMFGSTLLCVFDKINGYGEDLYGDVTPVEIITSLGPSWNFTPGHQDAHELFHVVLGALQAEIRPANRKGCLSDALPPSPAVVPDMKGSGDPLGLRSVSCNDIVSVDKGSNTPNGFDKNCNNHIMTSTPLIPNTSMTLTRPGMILARSSELLLRSLKDDEEEKRSFRSWNSLCTIPMLNIPSISVELHPFSGLLTSQLQCTKCNWKSSVRYDKLETISLPLPPVLPYSKSREHTLTDLLSRFVTSEIVQDVQCDGCASRCPAIKTLTLGKLPKCLCLHIPRTTWSSSGMPVKRDDPIIFSETLVLDPFTFTETKKRSLQRIPGNFVNGTTMHGKHNYQLRAVVEHRGPVDSGHFVCYRRGNRANQWLFTSDTIVENISLADVLSASPYLLFYERTNGSCE